MGVDVEKIKEIRISTVAKKLGIEIKRNKALCYTGHDNKTPSLTFNDKKGLFHCFGCDEGGDNIKLVENVLKLNFIESCRWIEESFNLKATNSNSISKLTFIPKSVKQKEPFFLPNKKIYNWLINRLNLSEAGKEYLVSERGFSPQIIDELKIKDVVNPSEIAELLLENWSKESLFECGLFKITDDNRCKFVWWDHTILFPFFNIDFELVYIQGRRTRNTEPKYLNLFGVEPIMFNSKILTTLANEDRVFICEGVPDAITALQNRLPCIGVLGANGFKSKWLKYFIHLDVYVIPDTDMGGKVFFKDLSHHFNSIGKPLREVVLPDSTDLNEYLNGK